MPEVTSAPSTEPNIHELNNDYWAAYSTCITNQWLLLLRNIATLQNSGVSFERGLASNSSMRGATYTPCNRGQETFLAGVQPPWLRPVPELIPISRRKISYSPLRGHRLLSQCWQVSSSGAGTKPKSAHYERNKKYRANTARAAGFPLLSDPTQGHFTAYSGFMTFERTLSKAIYDKENVKMNRILVKMQEMLKPHHVLHSYFPSFEQNIRKLYDATVHEMKPDLGGVREKIKEIRTDILKDANPGSRVFNPADRAPLIAQGPAEYGRD